MQDIGEQAAEIILRFTGRQCRELYQSCKQRSKTVKLLEEKCKRADELIAKQKAELIECDQTMADLDFKRVEIDPPGILADLKVDLAEHNILFSVKENKENDTIDLIFRGEDSEAIQEALARVRKKLLENEQPGIEMLGPDKDLSDPDFRDVSGLSKEAIKEFSNPKKFYVDVENASDEILANYSNFVFHGRNKTTARIGPFESRDQAKAVRFAISQSPAYKDLKEEIEEEILDVSAEIKMLGHGREVKLLEAPRVKDSDLVQIKRGGALVKREPLNARIERCEKAAQAKFENPELVAKDRAIYMYTAPKDVRIATLGKGSR